MKTTLTNKLNVLNHLATPEIKQLYKSVDIAEQLVSEMKNSKGEPLKGEQRIDIKSYINIVLGLK